MADKQESPTYLDGKGHWRIKDRPELMEKAKEIVLEIRQYLCNTEFAPEPFTKPIDPNKLTVEFPSKILALFPDIEEAKREERERIGTELEIWMDEASPYKKIAQAEHAILKLKRGEALKGE